MSTLGSAPSMTSASGNIWQTLSNKMSLSAYNSNPSVQQKIRWYLAHKDELQLLNRNAQPYIHYVSQQVEKHGLPMELAFLPMIESGYRPNVSSPAKALGLWQLVPATARALGVSVSHAYDGRRNVAHSTRAALAYLKYLHNYFHNWPLALAAYNAGMGTVSKAIAYNKAHNRATDFWSLRLPKETRDYVPKLLAVSAIFSNPATYNVALKSGAQQTTLASVTMPARISVSRLAHLANMDAKSLLKLNPSIKSSKSNLAENFNVLVPADKARPLTVKLAQYHSTLTPIDG